MSESSSRTASFTVTDARYVGAKIAADLRILRALYGKPSDDWITAFAEEAALLLRDGYLASVDYGFREPTGNSWRYRLRYTATVGGHLNDSRPGGLPPVADLQDLDFYSFLTYSGSYHALTAARRTTVDAAMPLSRSSASEPSALDGSSTAGNTYGRNGTGVRRNVYNAF